MRRYSSAKASDACMLILIICIHDLSVLIGFTRCLSPSLESRDPDVSEDTQNIGESSGQTRGANLNSNVSTYIVIWSMKLWRMTFEYLFFHKR